jgi:1-acyl-sn-glycerol-3-phosphate acyltransferase
MVVLRSVLVWSYFLASLPVLWAVSAVIWLVALPFDPRRRAMHAFTCWWGAHYVGLVRAWEVTVEGREHIDPGRTYVLAPNHQSALDILLLFRIHRHFKWISKREAFKLPIVGWVLWMNDYVGVVRGDPRSIQRMMEDCTRHLQNGSSIMIFPEGTRSRDGRLRKFKHGAFTLACKARVPVIPIAIEGSFTALPKSALLLQSPPQGKRLQIVVRILEPIDPASANNDPATLQDLVRNRLVHEVAAIRNVPPDDVD